MVRWYIPESPTTQVGNSKVYLRLDGRCSLILFDSLGLKWKYEHRQFKLGYYSEKLQESDAKIRDRSYGRVQDHRFDNELTYTPDFILPDLDLFVEVKPNDLTRTEEIKIGRLAYRAKSDFLVLIGLDRFLRYYWFDLDYPEDLNDLNFLSSDELTIKQAFRTAREFGRKRTFAEFVEEFDDA